MFKYILSCNFSFWLLFLTAAKMSTLLPTQVGSKPWKHLLTSFFIHISVFLPRVEVRSEKIANLHSVPTLLKSLLSLVYTDS